MQWRHWPRSDVHNDASLKLGRCSQGYKRSVLWETQWEDSRRRFLAWHRMFCARYVSYMEQVYALGLCSLHLKMLSPADPQARLSTLQGALLKAGGELPGPAESLGDQAGRKARSLQVLPMRTPRAGSDQHQGSCRGCRGLAGKLAALGAHGRFCVAQLCWLSTRSSIHVCSDVIAAYI